MSFWREHVVKRLSRSRHWPKVRRQFIKGHHQCACCGRTRGLEVHHVAPFHLHPDLELDPVNLVTLCRADHLTFGHLKSWRSYNDEVLKDSEAYKLKVDKRP